jgi:hypothetical protein
MGLLEGIGICHQLEHVCEILPTIVGPPLPYILLTRRVHCINARFFNSQELETAAGGGDFGGFGACLVAR